MAALISLFSLTPEQRRFLWRKQISDTRTPSAWLALFAPLTAHESATGPRGCLTAGLVAGALGLLGAGLLLLAGGNDRLAGVVLFLFGLGCAAGALGSRFRLSGRHLREAINPLLAVLREDMKVDERVTLAIDLRGAERAANQCGRRNLPPRGAYPDVVEMSFADKWLRGEATLADGTRLTWEITDFVRCEVRSRRNARGKTKSKTRHRRATHLRIDLGWRKDRYGWREAPGPAAATDDGRRCWLKLRRTFRHADGEVFNTGQFVRAVAAGYAQVESVGGAT